MSNKILNPEYKKTRTQKSPRNSERRHSSFFLKGLSSITLLWKNLNYQYKSKDTQTTVLHNVSGHAKPGEILAVMGPSGCGKSTFLSMLSNSIPSQTNVEISGKIYINNHNIKKLDYPLYVSYLPQNNIFYDYFTVNEALLFAGKLKTNISEAQLNERIKNMLKLLKIKKIAHRKIGDFVNSSLSGGEIKRICIALALISDPCILILDEPTSGLDSANALIVMKLLQRLSANGKTIIISVHQAGNQLYSLFTKLILMQNGRFLFQGRPEYCMKYFKKLGFKCPKDMNPSDFFMKELYIRDSRNLTTTEKSKIDLFIQHYDKLDQFANLDESPNKELNLSAKRFKPGLILQIAQLSKRTNLGFIRNPMYLKFQIIKIIFFCVIGILLFYDLGTDLEGARNRVGAIICSIYSALYFPMVIDSFIFPLERTLVHNEIHEEMYSPEAYFFSKIIVEVPYYMIFASLTNCICYFPFNMNDSGRAFGVFTGISALAQINGIFQGHIAGGLSNDVVMASFIGPVLSTPPVLFSGFFSDVRSIPDAFEWLKFTTPYYYLYQALVINEFDGLDYDKNVEPDERFGLTGKVEDYVWMLIGNIIVSGIIGYLLIKFRANKYKNSIF